MLQINMSLLDVNVVKTYSEQDGGDLPYFIGKQYGSGWLRTLGRFAFPILKKVARVAGNVAQDALVNEKPILESLRDNTINEVASTMANPSSLMPINASKKQPMTTKRRRQQPLPLYTNQKRQRRR